MIRKKISEWYSCWCHADTKTRHAAQKHCATEQTTTMSAAGPGCSPVGARVISCFVCVSVYVRVQAGHATARCAYTE